MIQRECWSFRREPGNAHIVNVLMAFGILARNRVAKGDIPGIESP